MQPHYPAQSPLADVLRLVPPGSDSYITEKYAVEIEVQLKQWSESLKRSPHDLTVLFAMFDGSLEANSLKPVSESPLRSGYGIESVRRTFSAQTSIGRDRFLAELRSWLANVSKIQTAEFEIYGISVLQDSLLSVRTAIRFDIVSETSSEVREERVGSWQVEWTQSASRTWIARQWLIGDETLSTSRGPVFVDVTEHALGGQDSYRQQLLRGADDWRTVLDGAIGLDVYSNNGVAVGDFDNDGFDDFYVCQPAGLPNRLYRNRGDGTFEDVTEKAGLGILDSTACALFADFENKGVQDLLVVCGTGPLLFLNQGDGTFRQRSDAFKFARPPQGTFTHAAIADYDRDGRLDVYFCMYMYYLGLDQYHYPAPYYDARNGPPNCLFHNEGNGSFVELTEQAGMNSDNNRYSFACAWGNSNNNGLPDLFVSNDFGSSQLYRNKGNGTFSVASHESHVEGVGAGMGCAWCDYDNDGHQDVYVPSMWEAAGQRVSQQKQFHESAPPNIRELYQRHARGNALYRNQGDGTFQNVGHRAGVEMGRWSWSSDFWDFDHDGFSDLYVTNGYISSLNGDDMASFFWRQVVAKSPEDQTPSTPYERGWNAINELIRSDSTWHGYARNVLFVNNRNGTFSELSGPSGLDFIEDSRSFVLADLDHDGRLEVILKNRNAPQVRILHNAMRNIGHSIGFRLHGRQSNRDAIGASITVQAGTLRQTKYLQAGTGFLAQHTKELFFGVGDIEANISATVRWPNGLSQHFEAIPANHQIDIEEGSPTFTAKPFAAPTPGYAQSGPAPKLDPLPTQVETWLVDPLKAPAFSLPDLNGNLHALNASLRSCVLLTFWATTARQSIEQLKAFQQRYAAVSTHQLKLLAVNVDEPSSRHAAKTFASQANFSFPLLFATEEIAGIYNLVYRHLFDRRRDLAIPTSFLIDKEGMIVKLVQCAVEIERMLADVMSLPLSAEDRMRKALPFPGKLVQSTFQRNDFTYGVSFFQHGYLQQAAESFLQVLASKPDDPDAYYNLGTLALRRNDPAEARRYLEQALSLRPNYAEAWNNLGMIAAQAGEPDEAIANFRKSIALRPDYAIALLNLGNVYRRQHDFNHAQELLLQAVQLQPDDPETNYSVGMLYAQQNDMQQASEFLQRAIALRPAFPEALNNLGVLFVHQQDYSNAEQQFKNGIHVAPNYDQSYLNLARLYAIESQKEKAIAMLNQLLNLQPNNQTALSALKELQ